MRFLFVCFVFLGKKSSKIREKIKWKGKLNYYISISKKGNKYGSGKRECVCVYVRVCVRERERLYFAKSKSGNLNSLIYLFRRIG